MDDVGHQAALAIGRPGQGDGRVLTGHDVLDLNRVPDGVDIRQLLTGRGVQGAQPGSGDHVATRPQLQPRCLGQGVLRGHTDGQNNQIGRDLPTRLQVQEAALFGEMRDPVAQDQLDAVGLHLLMHHLGHLEVQGSQDLGHLLDQGDLQAPLDQVLGHFHADEATSNHHGPARSALLEEVCDRVGIRDIAQDEEVLGFGEPRNRRPDGAGSGREDQDVIALGVGLSGQGPADRDGPGLAVDPRHLAEVADVQIEAFGHSLNGLQQQLLAFLDDSADVVGQTAVGETDVLVPLKEDYPVFLA